MQIIYDFNNSTQKWNFYNLEETKYRKKAEEFIDSYNDLIPKFYNNKLYEYQDLVIYSNNF